MIYTIFENKPENLFPLTINHAAFEVRWGAFSMLDRICNSINKDDSIILVVRDELKEIISERYSDFSVNPDNIPPSILLPAHFSTIKNGLNNGKRLSNDMSLKDFNLFKDKLHFEDLYLWDFIFDIKDILLRNDTKFFDMKIGGDFHESCIFLNQKNIHISDSAKISAGVILDASEGPIIIDENAFIDIGVMIKGNTYIGKNSKINPGAKLNGEISIGPYCKIGGEVEATIFHGYSNKQHDGYIGHSYIGEWVNLGANTNNSDLKNNYGKIKFDLGFKKIDTNEMFIGSMIGDFSKIAISTMLNTGTYIGMGANVFGSGFQNKLIQSFSWGKKEVTDFKKFLSTLEVVKSRRDKNISEKEKNLLRTLYNNSQTKKF
ncbi:MAG: hypothetical protein CMG26_00950 [Candidatus Marinimicrobia bacterium]|nr:hypothetical protein [Candidatus Neomarinimicrobiota bacterium]|tara:strand:+ start:1325 stop:2452 length:1128 start_codon:yes stop_codon:yes gene_type:complete